MTEQPSPRPIDTELEFSSLVRRLGGTVIRDVMPDAPSMSLNCDYFFPQENVAVELKSLKKDKFGGHDGFQELIDILRKASVSDASIVAWFQHRRQLSVRGLNAIIRSASRLVENQARKAQHQIRDTIGRFGNEETKGLVLIANDNSHFIPPVQMLHVIAGVFTRHFNNPPMDAFVYFTPNVPSTRFLGDHNWQFWIPGYRDDKDNAIGNFVDWLGKGWLDHHNKILGASPANIEIADNVEELVRD